MITYKDFILVKGKSYQIVIPFSVTGYTNLSVSLFTNDKAKVVPSIIEEVEAGLAVTFNPEVLDDGVVYYELEYDVEGIKQVKSTNTPYVIRTPEGYSAQTADVIYASGETAGAEAQKALMVGATIVENGEYIRPDGYSAVTVSVSGALPTLQVKSEYFGFNETKVVTPDQGYDGLSAVNITVNTREAQWKYYEDNRFRYAKQMCYNPDDAEAGHPDYMDGTYLCHIEENSYLAGVDIAQGIITGYTGWGMMKIGDSDHYFKQITDQYNRVQTFECWVENGEPTNYGYTRYLHWIVSTEISTLDAYNTGHRVAKYGWPMP